MTVLELIESLAKAGKCEHYYCDDSWYSCPLAESGCANDDVSPDKCNCGADEKNTEIDNILTQIKIKLSKEQE